jgi:hypothetical protein
MDDREVGELWRWGRQYAESNKKATWVRHSLDLIRKLVGERANSKLLSRSEMNPATRLAQALRDFNIDLATWEESDG